MSVWKKFLPGWTNKLSRDRSIEELHAGPVDVDRSVRFFNGADHAGQPVRRKILESVSVDAKGNRVVRFET